MTNSLFANALPLLAICMSSSVVCLAQVEVPEGTKVRVRLEQPLSSATAEVNQHVQLAVSEDVTVKGLVAIPRGAVVDGKILVAVPKRRMGRTGKLDFSIDDILASDGGKIPLRYSPVKKNGGSHTVRTGVITAGVAVLFWPAAPFVLLMQGKDANFAQGMTFEVFTNTAYSVKARPEPAVATAAVTTSATSVTITSDFPGADIEVDGKFAASTPSTLQLSPGAHKIRVSKDSKSWQRDVTVVAGDSVRLAATLEDATTAQR